MAWLEKDRHGRLRLAFKYHNGETYREPLGVEANKRTRADAERLRATIQLELTAGTFDYARRFPNSPRVAELGLKPAQERRDENLQEFGQRAWLAEKKTDVKHSTLIYYTEVFNAHVLNSDIGRTLLAEIGDEDVNRWKLEMETKRTLQGETLSTRRKNMALDVLCQILRLAKRRGLTNDKLLIDTKPFKNEENEGEVNPFSEEEIESLMAAAQPWERSLLHQSFQFAHDAHAAQ